MQMRIQDYQAAIKTLSALAVGNPLDPALLLDRAISELQINQLDAAKNDYLAVEKMSPDPPHMVYFGLAQVAQKQNDKPAEIRYERLYLQHAPRNTLEFTNVTRRLSSLESR
jgi:Flp pilus assembly protein TadD